MIKYAGIGSRETPGKVCVIMEQIGRDFARRGFLLRSGGAIGADQAFAHGATASHAMVFRPHHATPEAFDHAAKYHPAWDKCSASAMALHARNSLIMLGVSLNDPVDFVVCWTKDGKATGGTGQALRIAEAYEIPIFNLKLNPDASELMRFVNNL